MRNRIGQALVTGWLFVGCAPLLGPEPEDMSAPEHEQAARAQEDAAAKEDAKFDPSATVTSEHCQPPLLSDLSTSGLCWTADWNPTEEHLREAERHRRVAARHRAASKELLEEESSACRGVAPDDRDIEPFMRAGAIRSVEPLLDDGELEGVIVEFRNAPGLTASRMEAVVSCHLARNAARGPVVPGTRDSPLLLRGLDVEVTEGESNAVRVRIEAPDRPTAEEALARARRSAAPR